MNYAPNTDADRAAMLRAVGVESIDDLFADIPAQHRDPELDLPPALPAAESEPDEEDVPFGWLPPASGA